MIKLSFRLLSRIKYIFDKIKNIIVESSFKNKEKYSNYVNIFFLKRNRLRYRIFKGKKEFDLQLANFLLLNPHNLSHGNISHF